MIATLTTLGVWGGAGCAADVADPAASTQAAPPELPAGHRWTTVPSQHLTFAVPDSWVLYSSDDSPENLAAAAKALGISVEALKATLPEQTPLQVRAPAPDPTNLNATVIDLGKLPPKGELESQLRGAGAEDLEVTSVDTPAGEGLLATYQRPLAGKLAGTPVHGAGLFLDNGDSLLNLTLSSPKADTTTSEMRVVIASIHRS